MNYALDWIFMFVFLVVLYVFTMKVHKRLKVKRIPPYKEGEMILVCDGNHWTRRIFISQINDGRIVCVSLEFEDKYLAKMPFEMRIWDSHQRLKPDPPMDFSIQTDESLKFMNL